MVAFITFLYRSHKRRPTPQELSQRKAEMPVYFSDYASLTARQGGVAMTSYNSRIRNQNAGVMVQHNARLKCVQGQRGRDTNRTNSQPNSWLRRAREGRLGQATECSSGCRSYKSAPSGY